VSNLFNINDSKKFFSFNFIGDETYIEDIRAKISNAFLFIVSFLLIPAVAGLIYRGIDIGWKTVQVSTLAIMVFWWLVALFRNKVSHQVRSYVTVTCLYCISTTGLINLGLLSMGIPGYIACCILTAIFLGVDKSLVAAAICFGSIVAIGYGISSEIIPITINADIFNMSKGAWTATSIIFFVVMGSLILCLAGFTGALMSLIGKVQEQSAEIVESHDRLEELVNERTGELTREIEVRKAREKEIEQSEERFKSFTEIAADRYWETDENHNISFAPVLTKQTNKLGIEVIGKKAWETELVLSDEDKKSLIEKFESKEDFKGLQICWRLPTGENLYRRLSGVPFRDSNGKFAGFRLIGIVESADSMRSDIPEGQIS
tara:strand:- start:1569 stop:2693 length:1125 start_codon:yes stop_codon:yes gene_type:complete